MKKILVLGLVLALFTATGFAQSSREHMRRSPMQHRFDQGQLTRGEKHKLHKNHKEYRKTERRFKRDGHFSKRERATLYKMKQHNKRQSYKYRHNARKRVI